VTGGSTLEKLDDYISKCDGVIHLIGQGFWETARRACCGRTAPEVPDFAAELAPLRSSTRQGAAGLRLHAMGAYLGIYHRRPVFVYRPTDFELDALHVPRHADFVFSTAERAVAKEPLRTHRRAGHDRGQFLNEERLSSAVLRDLVEILPGWRRPSPSPLPSSATPPSGSSDAKRISFGSMPLGTTPTRTSSSSALRGMGKTSLVATWMAELALKSWRGAERVFDWSFYSQGTSDQRLPRRIPSSPPPSRPSVTPTRRAAPRGIAERALPSSSGSSVACSCSMVLSRFNTHPGRWRESSRTPLSKPCSKASPPECRAVRRHNARESPRHPATLWPHRRRHRAHCAHRPRRRRPPAPPRSHARWSAGDQPDDRELQAASREVRGHGLTLQLLGQYLKLVEGGDIPEAATPCTSPMPTANTRTTPIEPTATPSSRWEPTSDGFSGRRARSPSARSIAPARPL